MARLFRLTLLSLPLMLTFAVAAQEAEETPPTESEPAPATPAGEPSEPEADPVEEWKQAIARRLEIFNELQTLGKTFQAAETREEKLKLRDEYDGLIREFEVSVYPKMLDLADDIYAQDPDDLNAAEIVMQKAFHDDRYEVSGAIASKLLAADRRGRSVVRIAGLSQYALHNFEEAARLLTEARDNEWLDFRQVEYVDHAKAYVDLWKAEQEIRERESALEGDEALPQVTFETEHGQIVVQLFEDQAPNTVANFINLIENGTYDGLKFHRVVPGFVIQGGDPNSRDDNPADDGYGGPGYSIKCECYREDARLHFRGSLSMAHSGPDTGGSQFFITHKPTPHLNPTLEPQKGGHTVFGRVVKGMDVVVAIEKGDAITKAAVLNKRPHEYEPDVTKDVAPEPDTNDETGTDPGGKASSE